MNQTEYLHGNLRYFFFWCFYFIVEFGNAVTSKVEDQLLDNIDENLVMKALDGFLIVLSTEGDVIYVSENIQDYIGIQQVCY